MENTIIKRYISPMIGENTYLIADLDTKKAAIIDPGVQSKELEGVVKENDLEVEAICLTHAHSDHIMALPYYRDLYKPEVYIHEKEKALLQDANNNISLPMKGGSLTFDADHYFKDGDVISSLGLKVYYTPGHTIGSSCFEWRGHLFAGDTLFRDSCGRWDLPTGNAHDMAQSLKRLFQIKEDLIVECGHGPSTTLAYERANNPMLDYLKIF